MAKRRYKVRIRTCSVPGCGRKHAGLGFCRMPLHAAMEGQRRVRTEQRPARALHRAWLQRAALGEGAVPAALATQSPSTVESDWRLTTAG